MGYSPPEHKGIVTQHYGTIQVYSKTGEGEGREEQAVETHTTPWSLLMCKSLCNNCTCSTIIVLHVQTTGVMKHTITADNNKAGTSTACPSDCVCTYTNPCAAAAGGLLQHTIYNVVHLIM